MEEKQFSSKSKIHLKNTLKRVFWWIIYIFDFAVAPPLLWQKIRGMETLAGELVFKLLMLWAIFTLLLIGRLIFLFATRKMTLMARKEAAEGYLCILPWLIGFTAFTLGPMIFSIYISMCDWDIINPPKFIGLANFRASVVPRLQVRESAKSNGNLCRIRPSTRLDGFSSVSDTA